MCYYIDLLCVKVEYYPPVKPGEISELLEDLDIEDKTPKVKISDALAALGVYAHSMKPSKNWLTEGTSNQTPTDVRRVALTM